MPLYCVGATCGRKSRGGDKKQPFDLEWPYACMHAGEIDMFHNEMFIIISEVVC